MSISNMKSRRNLLAVIGSTAGIGLAGCTGDSDTTDNGDDTESDDSSTGRGEGDDSNDPIYESSDTESSSGEMIELSFRDNAEIPLTERGEPGYYFPSGVVQTDSGLVVVNQSTGNVVTFDEAASVVNSVDVDGLGSSVRGVSQSSGDGWVVSKEDTSSPPSLVQFDQNWNRVSVQELPDDQVSVRGGVTQRSDGYLVYNRGVHQLTSDFAYEATSVSVGDPIADIAVLDDGYLMATQMPELVDGQYDPPELRLYSAAWELLDAANLEHINPVGGIAIDRETLYVIHRFWGSADTQSAHISQYGLALSE